MNPSNLASFKRAIQTLGFQHKTHLTRNDIDRIIQELNLSRQYNLADYVRSLDPAAIDALLR